MRKALLPMLASLALCGAATAALIATNARAEQQNVHKPMMIALAGTTSGKTTAAPPAEGGQPAGLRDGAAAQDSMMGQRRDQLCRDLYAGKVGELAFLEAKLSLDAKQTPLFARWKEASLDIAKQHENDCAGRTRPDRTALHGQRPSVVDRMSLEEDLLKKRLADIEAERPALTALYNALSPTQKEEFSRGDIRHMPLHMMVGMMDHPGMRMMMRHGPMGGPGGPQASPPNGPQNGPMSGPPEPPPPPAQ